MWRRFSSLACAAGLVLACSLGATGAEVPAAVRQQVEQLIQASGAEVAVAFRTLDGQQELLLEPDKSFHAASTMKIPIMMELYAQAAAGKLSLADPLPVTNEFHSIVDGSVYTLDAADDSDAEVYEYVGRTMTLGELCRHMITRSSNLAANLLVEKLGVENIRRQVEAHDAGGMQVLRGVEDNKAYERGLNNTTTARGLLRLLEAITKGEAVNPEASRAMVKILKEQKSHDAIPAGLPPGTPVAHKTGDITRINHDAAIVYGPRPFVLVLLTRGLDDQKASAALMAAITRVLWQAAEPATAPAP